MSITQVLKLIAVKTCNKMINHTFKRIQGERKQQTHFGRRYSFWRSSNLKKVKETLAQQNSKVSINPHIEKKSVMHTKRTPRRIYYNSGHKYTKKELLISFSSYWKT